jgi:NADH-quinone oxidoreductase subunit M
VIMGPAGENGGHPFGDATWNEKLAAVLLIAGIVAMGVAPFWLNDLTEPGAAEVMSRISGMK